ncbi:hypothetical protein [Brucella cytisi]|uniref:hypothetical protein n=1 Tax=Brucella cytisi TaxID=407152 RepID=UPI0008FC81A4|nr:hypothetical protein [Brucella cytisi]
MIVQSGFYRASTITSIVLALAVALSACGLTSNGRALNLTDRENPPLTRANLLAPLGNGLLGSMAGKFSRAELNLALEAEYCALEYTLAGRSVSWSGNGSNSGEVGAAQPYQVGSQNCRQYSHNFTIKGFSQISRGTACRNLDGSWTHLK